MKKIGLSILTAAAIAVLLTLGNVRILRASSGCSNSTLHGSYAIHATGSVLSAGVWIPVAIVGTFTYDGVGGVTADVMQRVNGATSPVHVSGTYMVHADCSVTDTLGASTHFSEIFDHGKGFFILNTTVGVANVVSGEGRRQSGGERDDD
jgi:hypothetical protein